MAIIEVEVIDIFVISEILGTNQHVVAITDILTFRQNDHGSNLHGIAHEKLVFTEHVRISLSAHRFITDTLVFHQSAAKNQVGYVYQNLTFFESVYVGQYDVQTLDFTETVICDNTSGVLDTLVFTETIDIQMIRNIHVMDTLVLDSNVIGFLPKPSFINTPVTVPATPTPAPTTTIAVDAVLDVNPIIYKVSAVQYGAVVTLSSPNGSSITLKAPDFGNTDEIGQTRIQRQARGGDFIIWRAPYWPTSEEFALTFSHLNEATVARLQQVIQEAIGQLYTYVDHEGASWQVIITSPELEVQTTNYPKVSFKLMVVKEADA